jgi:hypothetical protein
MRRLCLYSDAALVGRSDGVAREGLTRGPLGLR